MKIYKVKVNGKVYEVELESVSENEKSIVNDVKEATPTNKESTNGTNTSVKAPMQGTILSVNVKVNDTVKKGQVLMIV